MSLIKYFLWLIFPKRCACCDRVIERYQNVCEECSTKLEKNKKICVKCGSDKRYCICKFRTYHFKGCVGPFDKNDETMQVIHHFKDDDNCDVADFLAEEMMPTINEYYSDVKFDGVCAVPSHWTKKFYKGYNHSELLANKIAYSMNLNYYNNLYKKRKTQIQHKLKPLERYENVKDAYGCKPLYGCKNILLIDDIKTTGATLDECSRQIMFAGAENVYCATSILNNSKSCNVQRKHI